MITDDEWDLIIDLTEVLSTFADATEDLEGSKYMTNNPDEEEDVAFESNDAEEDQDSGLNNKINEPTNTSGLLDVVKSRLYKNIMKYYPTLTTEYLIPSILDPRFKKLDFALEA
ncbi:unnamed protein product [Rhizophagus irregularis]|nr:unnamed protein product [Rhizophagus irregularis]